MIPVSKGIVAQSTSVLAGRLRTFSAVWRKWGNMTKLSVSPHWMRTIVLSARMYIRQSITMNYGRKRMIPFGVPSICKIQSRQSGCCSRNRSLTDLNWLILRASNRTVLLELPMWPMRETMISVRLLPKYSVRSISLPMCCLRKIMSRSPNRSWFP